MAEIEAKVNMSLDEIIKMEKQRKMNQRPQRGGGGTRGRSTSMGRNFSRGRSASRGRNNNQGQGNRMRSISRNRRGRNMRGGMRGGMRGRMSRRGGPPRGYSQNRGPYSNGVPNNMRRSRSRSMNRPNMMNGQMRGRGGYRSINRNRSRSRSNVRQGNRPNYMSNGFQMGPMSRTNSMPDLRDPQSVHSRLGYQNPNQIAYRNRVKRAKNTLLQRQNKAMLMQHALSLAGGNPMVHDRRFAIGNLHADQLMRAQRRAQYDQKLIRINNPHAHYPTMTMNYLNHPYVQQNPSMSFYRRRVQSPSPPRRQAPREPSPFEESLATLQQSLKAVAKQQAPKIRARQRRARSRSRSRARSKLRNRSIINLHDTADLEDRSFSEVMYSLSNNFGVTGRTLNDRFSLF